MNAATIAIQVFDKPMCCSTGVCGPDVDPALVQFASDLQWLKDQGCSVERYNLAQEPWAFLNEKTIQQWMTDRGVDCLPVIKVNGEIVSQQSYPTREQWLQWTGKQPLPVLPIAMKSKGGCCSGGSCG